MSSDHITRLRDTEASTRLCGGSLPHVTLSDLQAILAELDAVRQAAHDVLEHSDHDGYGQSAVDSEWLGKLEDASDWTPAVLSKPQQTDSESSRAGPKANSQTHHRGVWKP